MGTSERTVVFFRRFIPMRRFYLFTFLFSLRCRVPCLLSARAAGDNKSLIKTDFQVKIFIRFEMFDNKTISSFCYLVFINIFWAYTFRNLSDIFLS